LSRVIVFHPRPEEIAGGLALLRQTGHRVETWWPQGMPGLAPFRRDPPDAIVIDLSRQPSTGRALATALRQIKATREVPLVFVDGDPQKTAPVKATLPDATYTAWRGIRGALKRSARRRATKPVVPDTMAGYAGTPLPRKLGSRPGSTVALRGAPRDFEKTLGRLPEGARVRRDSRASANVILLFVKSRADLERRFGAAARTMGDPGALWVVWPKKASGVATDLGQQEVRAFGLAAGLVDYKIAAIDATWSGLCFARRKRRGGRQ
jgi:CheY-like chemotaxis protein